MEPAKTELEARVHQLRIYFAGTNLEAVSKAAEWLLDPKGKDILSIRSDLLHEQRTTDEKVPAMPYDKIFSEISRWCEANGYRLHIPMNGSPWFEQK